MVKIIRIAVIVFIILAMLPLLYIWGVWLYYSGSKSTEKIEYLRRNSTALNGRLEIPQNFIEAPDTSKTTIYMFGEIHGYAKTEDFAISMLEYLNRNYGVRDYFTEIYTEEAELLNRFLDAPSRNRGLLGKLLQYEKENIPQHHTEDFIRKWERLYNFNSSLDSAHRIIVHSLLGRQKDYKGMRDSAMLANFMACMKGIKGRVVYCSTGVGHIYRSPYVVKGHHVASLGTCLERKPSNKVVSIAHITLDSECYLPKESPFPTPRDEKTKLANADGPLLYFTNVENLREASPERGVCLYRLNVKGSPYKDGDDFVGYKSPVAFMVGEMTAEKGKSTIDYFQYLLLTRGYDAPTILKWEPCF